MTLDRYEVFLAVVERGTLSKAAEMVGLTQSAVSHAIASLESDFGMKLLSRGRNGIKLTSSGEMILPHIRNILHCNEVLLQEISNINGLEIGTIRIGTLPSVSIRWLPQIIKSYNELFPRVKIELYEGDYDSIEKWLLEGQIEIGFLSGTSVKSLDVLPLAKDYLQVIMPEHHPLSTKQSLKLAQLANEQFIMPKSSIDRDVRTLFKNAQLQPDIVYEISEDQAIVAMVQNGLGISVLPKMTLNYIPQNIVIIPLDEEYYRQISIASKSFKQMIPVAKKFVQFIEQWVKENYKW